MVDPVPVVDPVPERQPIADAAPPDAPALPTVPAAAPFDFSAVLATPNAPDDVPQPPAALLLGIEPRVGEDTSVDRSTIPERILLVLAVILPPIGFIGGIVAAALSNRRRGWVIGLVKATIAIGAVLSVVAGVGAYAARQYLHQQAFHAQLVAESAAFCSTVKNDPTMLQKPDFGWPAPAPSIPDSLAAMQAYVAKWTALEKASPSAIQGEVQKVVDAAGGIVGAVTVSRTIDDAQNVQVMTSVASQSGLQAWKSEYCS